ncbi:hypothetical protein C5167_038228 [Papaver somniferum]|uniref:AB hydrolase-1 domain-containing protein n=1 Tax=Papaver somniferum TaxID=3469 RepID=A0A4Y7ICZ9_PAPSO|nr:hypothetical protein C5167_038228 [Papaver somniferum]
MKDERNSFVATNSSSKSTNKHFVLVHGGCHGAWCWFKLTPLLKSAGHRVTVLDLAGSGINSKQVNDLRSFSDYIHPFMEFMEYSVPGGISVKPEEKVILVGHSLGGLVISKAMEMFPEKISVAVFVTALMPNMSEEINISDVGKEVLTIIVHRLEQLSFMVPQHIYRRVKDIPTASICGPNYLSSTLYNLSPPEDIALAIMLMRPVRMYSMKDMLKEIAMTKQKYGSVKRVYIISEQDKAISKDFQRSIIEKDPTDEVKEITGSDHMVMISQPQQLFVCLQEIAEKA